MVGGVFWQRQAKDPNRKPEARIRVQDRNADVTERFQDLEKREAALDRDVWAKEIDAQRHEEVLVRLWDQLRGAPDPYAVAERFAFGQIVIGNPPGTNESRGEITIRQHGPAGEGLTQAGFQTLLARLKGSGYTLDQSEFRHARFEPAAGGKAAHSTFVFSLHGERVQQRERIIVRGNLQVEWEESKDDRPPFPTRLAATDFTILSRTGAPYFDEGPPIEFTLQEKALDPFVIAYDLNHDGLSELLLCRENLLYWNRGGGRFETAPISKTLRSDITSAVVADFDDDGMADFLAADATGLMLWGGSASGAFSDQGRRVWVAPEKLQNPIVITAGDIDKDGDLDIWLAQYKIPYLTGQMPTPYYDANDGFPSYLLVNNGTAVFADETARRGLAKKRFRRTYSCSFADVDGDADLDLVVVSDFSGVDMYDNDGQGFFRDTTVETLAEHRAFGMALTMGDYDQDGQTDLFVVGMNSYVADRLDALGLGIADKPDYQANRAVMAFGNWLLFRRGGRFEQGPASLQVARSGWSWGATSFDFDNDGDLDIYVASGHKSQATAKDYESQFWRHDIYAGASQPDPALERYFGAVGARLAGSSYGGYYKNSLFINEAGRGFIEAAHLLGVALEQDSRNVISDDLNADGNLDLLVCTQESWPKPRQALHIFRNRGQAGNHWIGFRLREEGAGYSPVGALVSLDLGGKKQLRRLVTGDSFRSQHAATAHFGIGAETNVPSVEIQWMNGRTRTIQNPGIDRYHDIRGRSTK